MRSYPISSRINSAVNDEEVDQQRRSRQSARIPQNFLFCLKPIIYCEPISSAVLQVQHVSANSYSLLHRNGLRLSSQRKTSIESVLRYNLRCSERHSSDRSAQSDFTPTLFDRSRGRESTPARNQSRSHVVFQFRYRIHDHPPDTSEGRTAIGA